MAACPGCGLDEATIAIPDAIVALRSFPRRWRELFESYRATDGDAVLSQRPAPETWSAMEYAAHTRDVLRSLGYALGQVLVHDGIAFPTPPSPDEVAAGYAGGDATVAVSELGAAATELADDASRVATADWGRRFRVGDDEHTASWIVQHAAHEGAHHLRDAARGLATVTGHEPS